MNKRQQGYTLIEVLVALLVFSLGVLGMAALQVAGLKQNQNAYQRSQALVAANDIADRMRSNVAGVQLGSYFGSEDAFDDSKGRDSSCVNANCTAAQLATFDLNNWKLNLQNSIEGGGGCVARRSGVTLSSRVSADDLDTLCEGNKDAGEAVTIYIWWDDSRYQNASEAADEVAPLQVISLTTDL